MIPFASRQHTGRVTGTNGAERPPKGWGDELYGRKRGELPTEEGKPKTEGKEGTHNHTDTNKLRPTHTDTDTHMEKTL